MSHTRGALIAGAIASGISAGACALLAPRMGDEDVEKKWEGLRLYRYAHRGLFDNRTPAPENSLAAFLLAREAGYGSELDVHLSADGVPVVMHDSSLLRACGTQGIVERRTAAELGWLRLFGTKERVPTLEQVLEVYEGGTQGFPPLIIEMKTWEGNVASLMERTMAVLDRHVVPYCIESFDPRVLVWLRRRRGEVVRGQLTENFMLDNQAGIGTAAGLAHASLAYNVATRPDFIAVRYEDRALLSVALSCGVLGARRVYWTIHTEEELEVCDQQGALAIFEGFEPEP